MSVCLSDSVSPPTSSPARSVYCLVRLSLCLRACLSVSLSKQVSLSPSSLVLLACISLSFSPISLFHSLSCLSAGLPFRLFLISFFVFFLSLYFVFRSVHLCPCLSHRLCLPVCLLIYLSYSVWPSLDPPPPLPPPTLSLLFVCLSLYVFVCRLVSIPLPTPHPLSLPPVQEEAGEGEEGGREGVVKGVHVENVFSVSMLKYST